MPLMQLDVARAAVARDPAAGADAPVAGDGGAGKPQIGVAKPAISADPGAVLLGYGAVALGAAIGIGLRALRDPSSFRPGSGISVFAPLYILAQAIERFIEPFSSYIGATAPEAGADKGKKTKADAMEQVHLALAGSDAGRAAECQRLVDRIRRNTAVIAWGLA